MLIEQFLEELWNQYVRIAPSAGAIRELFAHWGEGLAHDHLVIRTFNDPRVNIPMLARPFTDKGYLARSEYEAEEGKLRVVCYEHGERPGLPKVYLWELRLERFSPVLREIVFNTLRDTPRGIWKDPDLILKGRIWGLPGYEIYERLRQESEFAAWVYVFGFCVNHFTVSVNALRNFGSLQQVISFLQANGFVLHTAGGLIKGGPEELVERSATATDRVPVQFREGSFWIPAADYLFARRGSGAGTGWPDVHVRQPPGSFQWAGR